MLNILFIFALDMTKHKTYDLTTVKGRLLEFLRHERISQVEFAERLGVSPTYIGAMRKGLSSEKMLKLGELFPQLNREWLSYGKGEMLLENIVPTRVLPSASRETSDATGRVALSEDDRRFDGARHLTEASGNLVPLLPVEAFAGNLQLWSQPVRRMDCETVLAPVTPADFAIRISGDSMEPEFSDGTMLFLRRIIDRNFMPWGHPVVIDTSNGVIFKLIYPGDDKGSDSYIEARSLNPRYPAMRISTDTVLGIYRVCASMRIYNTI